MSDSEQLRADLSDPSVMATRRAWQALALVAINFTMWMVPAVQDSGLFLPLFTIFALAQLICGVLAVVWGRRAARSTQTFGGGGGPIIVGVLTSLGAPLGWIIAVLSTVSWRLHN